MTVRDQFPDFLRERMARAGLTGAELARRAGLSRGTVSRMLAGSHLPSVDVCGRLAPALGIELVELWIAAGHISLADDESVDMERMLIRCSYLLDLTEEEWLETLAFIRRLKIRRD